MSDSVLVQYAARPIIEQASFAVGCTYWGVLCQVLRCSNKGYLFLPPLSLCKPLFISTCTCASICTCTCMLYIPPLILMLSVVGLCNTHQHVFVRHTPSISYHTELYYSSIESVGATKRKYTHYLTAIDGRLYTTLRFVNRVNNYAEGTLN